MTIKQILEAVHREYEQNTSYPGDNQEETISRLEFANDYIRLWENQVMQGVDWSELVKEFQITVTNGVASVPADFLKVKQLYLGGQEYMPVPMNEGIRRKQESSTDRVFWVTAGNINILPATSGTATLYYYKEAHTYTDINDSTPVEMSIPEFVKKGVMFELYLVDDETNLATVRQEEANGMLNQMISQSRRPPGGYVHVVRDEIPGFGF